MKIQFIFILVVLIATQCQRDPYREGGKLYAKHCANCHGDNGQGLGELIPTLAQADYIGQNRAALPCILVRGLADTIVVNGKTYAGQPMPANADLNEIQVANILNYIHNSWGNQHKDFTLEEVRKQLESCR